MIALLIEEFVRGYGFQLKSRESTIEGAGLNTGLSVQYRLIIDSLNQRERELLPVFPDLPFRGTARTLNVCVERLKQLASSKEAGNTRKGRASCV